MHTHHPFIVIIMSSLADYGVPYPAAAPGQERKVIYLPKLDESMEEDHLRVQLIPGRHEDCEDGRLYHLTGTISEGEIAGWGYNYYVVTLGDLYAAHRTPANSENADTFVAMYEKPMIRYNSKLPIVIYVPEGAEVRYRVWMDEQGRAVEASGALAAPHNYADMEELDDGRHNGHAVKAADYPQEAHPQQQQEQQAYPAPTDSRGNPGGVQSFVEYAECRPLQTEEVDAQGEPPAPAYDDEYVENTQAAPVLRASEKATPQEQPPAPREGVEQHRQQQQQNEMPNSETQLPGKEGHQKSDPNSERRHHSSSRPRRHTSSSDAGKSRPERHHSLSATEDAPAENSAKAPKPTSGRAPSATSNHARHSSVDKSHNESSNTARRESTSSNKDKGKDDAYERKAKNFWNRARGNSKSKSPSKKADVKGDQWMEM